MEPLSIAASVIGILGAAEQCVKGIAKLRALKQTSSELSALINEIEDLKTVLTQFIALNQQLQKNVSDGSVIALKSLLKRAEEQLLALNDLVQSELSKPKSKRSGGAIRVDHLGWMLNKHQLASLQQSLRTTRLNLATALGVINSCALTRIELVLQSISTSQDTDSTLLQHILAQMPIATSRHSSTEDGPASPLFPNSSIARLRDHHVTFDRSWEAQRNSGRLVNQDLVSTIHIKARARTTRVSCRRWCSCTCHKQRTFRYPDWLRAAIGGLFVGYTGIPVFTPSCTETNCHQRSGPSIEVTYHFPNWFLSRVLSLSLHLSSLAGPELNLRMPRMVNWTTPLWQKSQIGDIHAIQALFGSGRGSPYDVNAYGQSSLHYAANICSVALCRFLIQNNADVYLRDENGRRPIDNAWDVVLSDDLPTRRASEIRDIFSDGEYLETRQFSVLHKIVLGLFPGSLTTQLDLSSAQINTIDANGRTCLSWAAARGDLTTLNTLLEHGADPRIADMEGCPPIFHAIKAKTLPCVSSLISTTVNFRTLNVFGGTALHIACAVSDNPAMLKLLVEECHIDMNAIDYDGDTALNYAARAKFDQNVRYLLDAGADPNIANVAGETTLHMAVYWDALKTLEELVVRGIDSKLMTMRGETLLHVLACHFDPQILKIMRRATCLKDIDPYVVDKDGHTYFDRLTIDRDDTGNAERVKAFQDFLNDIGNDVESDIEFFQDAEEYFVV